MHYNGLFSALANKAYLWLHNEGDLIVYLESFFKTKSGNYILQAQHSTNHIFSHPFLWEKINEA